MSDSTTSKIQLQPFLEDFRANLPDRELMKKYNLSATSFVRLVKVLVSKNIVTPQDLERRKQAAVQRDLAKESEFLSGLFICPNCGHPHPEPFDICPACDTDIRQFTEDSSGAESVTTTHAHIYVDDSGEEEIMGEPEGWDDEEEAATEPPEPVEDSGSKEKKSSLNSVRSFFSKFKK